MEFGKPALTAPRQVARLKSRGMDMGNEAQAERWLRRIPYYRLKPYWLPFEIPAGDGGGKMFREGTSFESILSLYAFDRELRILVLGAVEPVEIALRGEWVRLIAESHGPHGYLNQDIHFDKRQHAESVSSLAKEFRRSTDDFSRHYREKYAHPPLPPVWMAAEILSLGQLSKWIANLRRADRKLIADAFALHEQGLVSVMHHLSYIRNICAHHGRLWNKHLIFAMAASKFPEVLQESLRGAHEHRLYGTLVMLDYLLAFAAPEMQWRERVVGLLDGCPLADTSRMGFPEDWRTRPAWRT